MPNRGTFQFRAREVEEWVGRYDRIPGARSVFKVTRSGGQYVIQAFIQTPEGRVACEALPSQAVERLIASINMVKWLYNRRPGGSFLINEYGQVLVPTGNKRRFYVGDTAGVMLLRNLDTQEIVDLSDDTDLATGAPWDQPYIGTVYKLHRSSQIYYWDEATNCCIWPQFQDWGLIHKIRSVRHSGAVRLVVNPYGLVLTKAPVGEFSLDEDEWSAVYVGRIDYSKWFAREEAKKCRTSS